MSSGGAPPSGGVLQTHLDAVRATTLQRWVLGIVAVLAAGSAALVAAAQAYGWGHGSPVIVGVVAGLAAAAALRPESGFGVLVVAVVVWRWIVVTDDAVTDPHAPLVAAGLLVFHTSIALMAVTPADARIPRPLMLRWAVRTAVVVVATFAVWGLVVGMDSRAISGSTALSAAALIALAATTFALRSRSLRSE